MGDPRERGGRSGGGILVDQPTRLGKAPAAGGQGNVRLLLCFRVLGGAKGGEDYSINLPPLSARTVQRKGSIVRKSLTLA